MPSVLTSHAEQLQTYLSILGANRNVTNAITRRLYLDLFFLGTEKWRPQEAGIYGRNMPFIRRRPTQVTIGRTRRLDRETLGRSLQTGTRRQSAIRHLA